MIAVSHTAVNRMLALLSGLRHEIEDPAPDTKAFISRLQNGCACPIGVTALLEMEEELIGADEIPLIENDD